jgi:hypothetical protein
MDIEIVNQDLFQVLLRRNEENMATLKNTQKSEAIHQMETGGH